MKARIFGLSLAISITFQGAFAQADPDVSLFASGFDLPVNIKNAGDDRLFVVEQEGVIRVLNSDGTINATPFLDIDSEVINITGIGDERGLLGLAFHPNYSANGYFYVNYINNSGDTEIVRYTVSGGNSNVADPNSDQLLLTIAQPFPNHNAGDMAFGSDGYLYIATGDGGSGGDPGDRGQRLNTLLGKILRIDVDSGSPYSIPSDNPFLNDGDGNTLPEIWAYGLRNPFKMSFDRLNNDLWIGDVGQGEFEEVNRAASTDAGLNYGWRCYEANSAFNTGGCPNASELTFPVGAYSHFDGAFKCSVIGGYRYRGSTYENFEGLYFFADYCSGELGILEENGSSWDLTLTDVSSGNSWSAFGETNNGELVMADLDSGTIYRLIDNNLSTNEFEINSVKLFPNPANSEVIIDFSAIPSLMEIYNINGQKVLELKDAQSARIQLDISNFNSGLYFIKSYFTDGKVELNKLAVH
ncbi:MAG: PQQ-dependent sugar dehydrogenase [bacterium]